MSTTYRFVCDDCRASSCAFAQSSGAGDISSWGGEHVDAALRFVFEHGFHALRFTSKHELEARVCRA